MSAKHVLIALGVIAVAGAAVGAHLWFKRAKGVVVTTETVQLRDLEAIVSASGKIQPKRSVNISSDTVGRVVDLAVKEGDRVQKGQFLLQIDPKSLRSRVESGAASLRAVEVTLDQLRQATETARAQLDQARQTLARQQDLWSQQLTTREALEKATGDVRVAESALEERQKQANAQASRVQQERATLESARYDLSKVRIESPIDGIVTRRNIEEGEMVMIGTVNNPGTILMTLADMSVIQAEIEVDETSIPSVATGQPAQVTIDALPDRTFKGHVTEIGNSPIQATTTTGTTGTQATNFKVVVAIDEPIPEVRPGFTCTADITTATRKNAAAVPIPAVAVRELIYDANGQIVREPRGDSRSKTEPVATAELKPGQTRKETEGVFVLRNGRAKFVPITMGIAGEKYFEVLSGLRPGDAVITGPYNSVRGMSDGDQVRLETKKTS